jgi:nucleoid-associated protein YgaU
MSLEHAEIQILDKKVIDAARGLPATIKVQFNPTEYSRTKAAQIAEIGIPGIDSPLLQFVRGQNEKLTLELFFDTTDDGMGENATPVTDRTRLIYQLVKIQPETHAPPRIRFQWSSSLQFDAIVESVQQKFTLFNPNGVPLRATLTVTFREFKSLDEQLRELNLQSPDHTKNWVVRRGDTLTSIAAREYDDPTVWRVIADAPENAGKIDSPRRLAPGIVLTIPVLGSAALARGGRA